MPARRHASVQEKTTPHLIQNTYMENSHISDKELQKAFADGFAAHFGFFSSNVELSLLEYN